MVVAAVVVVVVVAVVELAVAVTAGSMVTLATCNMIRVAGLIREPQTKP